MNTISRTITGILTTLLGIYLIRIAILNTLWLLIYGIPFFIIGLFIFFNKKEDQVEKIKNK
jgi:membrane-bound ClpP family serine protease